MNFPHFARRIYRLGTETAFAVSDDARAWAEKGHAVYPFHLGDINLGTPANIIEAAHRAMVDGRTGYCPAPGLPELRDAIARDVGGARGVPYERENVSVQPGGKPVIAKFMMLLLERGSEALYPNPGYPIYESQIEYVGGVAIPYHYVSTDQGFRIDRDQVEAAITRRTRVIVYNNQQNPLGAESDREEMEWIAGLAKKYDLWVLSDEPYFDIRYSGVSESIASLPGMAERTVIAFTFSKRYAMTGWRLGAAIGPREVVDGFHKLNINFESCTAPFVQCAGIEALTGDQSGHQQMMEALRERRDVLVDQLAAIDGVRVHKPESTFYLFPEVTGVCERMGFADDQDLRVKTLENTGVAFCSRNHFGTPAANENKVFVRFAYSGIDAGQIEEGLAKLREYWAG